METINRIDDTVKIHEVVFDGITSDYGCYIQNASIKFDHEPGMNEIVQAIKFNGYKSFRLHQMQKFVNV
ncbi:MAG: hypothetical protein KH386_13510 [Bacteroides sp.]|nr:hypothetical protein [Bacteroides sp.]